MNKNKEEAQQDTGTSFRGENQAFSLRTSHLLSLSTSPQAPDASSSAFYPEFLISRRDLSSRTCPPGHGEALPAGAGTRGCLGEFGKGWGGTGRGKMPLPASGGKG